jgi:hypothetical protein
MTISTSSGSPISITDDLAKKFNTFEQSHSGHFPRETDESLSEKLRLFENEVDDIPVEKKSALHQAEEQCPELLDDAFKLAFLRTEVLDVKRAAARYAKYWELRINLFQGRAFMPLTVENAFPEDLEALRCGVVKPLPGNERVLVLDTSCLSGKAFDVDSLARYQWYVFTKALTESETMQRFGGIFVLNLNHTFQNLDLLKRISERANDGFPLRCAVACIVNPPRFVNPLLKIAKLFLRPRVRDKIVVLKSDKDFLRYVGLTQLEMNSRVEEESWIDRMVRDGDDSD